MHVSGKLKIRPLPVGFFSRSENGRLEFSAYGALDPTVGGVIGRIGCAPKV